MADPSEDLFVDTEPLFATVASLRGRFAAALEAGATPVVTVSYGPASETLGMLAAATDALTSAMPTQLEVAARLIDTGGLDACLADAVATRED